MGDAWIYTRRADADESASRMLAELGFSARRVAVNGSLRPGHQDGGSTRCPDIAMLLDGGGDAAPLYTRSSCIWPPTRPSSTGRRRPCRARASSPALPAI